MEESLYNAARLFVRKETIDLPTTCDNDLILITIDERELTEMIVRFINKHANLIIK